ncbi:UDP-N-acetylmuramoylalanine--D-glutamate ligase MurD [Planctomycetes bacterium Poly30]|uniref:UDP-N-acetylmuramoylalanine--D-glutamate ligase MurD n=2 Tax=Saltatorellus ferox TaxID=2528018 RepID=A0A518EXD1_9BACT|nr:UDP-N-acetylmuramoylalanine--D-glutamate ligase MurD [Planctomycetes bacterium Poly30]
MGLGLFGGGLGAASFALRKGARVTVTDQRDAETLRDAVEALRALPGSERVHLVLGEHREEDFRSADIVIVNPAVPPKAPFIGMAREGGARVTTAIELLLGGLGCRVVAVTGTHGKSSTVHFTAHLLRAALGPDVRVALGGNIGGSLLGELESFGPDDVVVLELSSYQLEHLSESFVAEAARTRVLDVAAITTLGVDHLARHGTIENYHAAKRRIGELTGQLGPDPGTVIVPAATAGSFTGVQRLILHDEESSGPPSWRRTATEALRVPGAFQRENLGLALRIGSALGADETAMAQAIPGLTGLPHRMERLTEMTTLRDGRVLLVHDNGVSTTPESTVSALESLGSPAGERVVLVGGQAKEGCDMAALVRTAARLDWEIVPFGAAAREIAEAGRLAGARLRGPGAAGDGQKGDAWPAGAEAAVDAALESSSSGPAAAACVGLAPLNVLFSPACASFDRYPNFSARAEAFRRAMAAHLA